MASTNDDLFDLVIFGIDAESTAYDDARHRIALLMGVPDEEVEDALAIGGRVVTAGLSRSDAEENFATLKALGVQCNVRPSVRSGRALSLVPMSLERELACPRCNHEHVYMRDEQPPEQCASCGLVFAKYERAQAEAAERDRIRAELLAKHGHLTAEQEREQREREDAERRKRIEEELRRELGLPKIAQSRKGLLATAAGLVVLGIVVGAGTTFLLRAFDGSATATTATASAPTSGDAGAAAPADDPALEARAVVSELDAAGAKDAATPGDLASVAPTRGSAESTLAALSQDTLYESELAVKGDALLGAGANGSSTQLLGQARNKSRAIRAIADAAARRARASGDPGSAATTLDSLATTVGQMPPDSPTRVGDLAHVARAQITSGLVDAANTQVEKLRQWTAQARTPAARVEANAEVASLLHRLGKADDAQAAFRLANEGLREVPERGMRVPLVIGLARSYADAGSAGAAGLLIESAAQSAARIPDPEQRVNALRAIAEYHAEQGNVKSALLVTGTIDQAALRADVELGIVELLIARDRIAAATEVADAIVVPAYKARALGRLAVGQYRSASPIFGALAGETLRMARTEAERATDGGERSLLAGDLARCAAAIGDTASATAWFGESEQLAAAITDEALRNTLAGVLAGNLARAGRITEAQRVASAITDQALIVNVNDDIARVGTVADLVAAARAVAPARAPAAAPAAADPAAAPGTAEPAAAAP